MNPNDEFDPKLITHLEGLRATPTRDPQQAARTRTAFLAEAAQLAKTAPTAKRAPVAGWKNPFATLQLTPALRLAVIALLTVGIVLGSGTLTVAAAQNSLPHETLYPVKTWSEDLRLGMTQNPDEHLALDLEFANRRVDEIQQLLETEAVPPETVLARLENQVEAALQIAASYPDEKAGPALAQIELQLRGRKTELGQLQRQESAPAAQARLRAQAILEANAQLAEAGAGQPAWLREQFRLRRQENRPGPLPTNTLTASAPTDTLIPTGSSAASATPTPGQTATPGAGNSYGPGQPLGPAITGTPTPGNGYGPGGPQQTPSNPKKTPKKPDKTPGKGNK